MAERRVRVRNYCYTKNNPTEGPVAWSRRWIQTGWVRYHVFQLELSDSGTQHYQGYIEFTKPIGLRALKKVDSTMHIAPRRKTPEQARNYCMKTDTRVSGPWEDGKFKGTQGYRTDIADAMRTAMATNDVRVLIEQHPVEYCKYSRGLEKAMFYTQDKRTSPPKVILYYGPTGTGKTKKVFEDYDDKLYRKPPDTTWFDGYCNQPCLLLDDFAGKMSKFGLTYLLQLLDRYELNVAIKGGHVPLLATTIIITTNIHPKLWYDFSTRQAQYPALMRRIHEFWWFKDFDEAPIYLDRTSFIDGWYETCDEESIFRSVTRPNTPRESDDDTDVDDDDLIEVTMEDHTRPTRTTAGTVTIPSVADIAQHKADHVIDLDEPHPIDCAQYD